MLWGMLMENFDAVVLGMELEPGNREPWKQSLRLKCDVG